MAVTVTRRRRFGGLFVALLIVAAVFVVSASAAFRQIYFVGTPDSAWIVYAGQDRVDSGWNYNNSSDVNALTGQTSNTICSGCLVHAYLVRPNGTRPCDGTAYGWVYCSLEPNQSIYTRAHCHNPSSGSDRWFQCWKWTG